MGAERKSRDDRQGDGALKELRVFADSEDTER